MNTSSNSDALTSNNTITSEYDIKTLFERDGFVGPFKLYEPEQARDILSEIRIYNQIRDKVLYDNEVNYDRHFDIPPLREHIGNPKIVEILRQILSDHILCWRTEFFPKFPSTAGTAWHQVANYAYATGNPMLVSKKGASDLFLDITVWTSFTEATRENGCMKFLPGSHKKLYYDELKSVSCGRDTHYTSVQSNTTFFGYEFEDFKIDPDWTPDESAAFPMEMNAGECVIFSARCVHGSYPNTTRRKTRFACSARYTRTDVCVYPGWSHFVAHGGTFDLSNYGCVLVSGRNIYGHNRLRTTDNHGELFPYVVLNGVDNP